MDVMEHCKKTGVIPVVVIEHAQHALPAAEALLAGGLDVMEITMRTTAALDAIGAVSAKCPSTLVGAGTVITLEQCKAAVAAGAKFIVSPGLDLEVVRWCVENGVPILPGCITPSEIMAVMKLGISIIKFFPASVYGGLKAMKSLAAPFPGIQFVPTGGIGRDYLDEYLSSPFIHAVGGSWMCTKEDIRAGNFEKITRLSREASNTVVKSRGQ